MFASMIEMKTCSNIKCLNPLLPATDEFFYGQWMNGASGKYYKLSAQCKVCRRQSQLKYKRENPDKVTQSEKTWYANNKEKKLNDHRLWREKNRERWSELMREYQQSEVGRKKFSQYGKDRRQNKSHEISEKEWIKCKEYFFNQCSYCGLHIDDHWVKYRGQYKLYDFSKEHVDHDGANDLSNCVPSCRDCNSFKSAIPFEVWYDIDNPSYTEERYERIIQWLTTDYLNFIKGKE